MAHQLWEYFYMEKATELLCQHGFCNFLFRTFLSQSVSFVEQRGKNRTNYYRGSRSFVPIEDHSLNSREETVVTLQVVEANPYIVVKASARNSDKNINSCVFFIEKKLLKIAAPQCRHYS